MVRYSNEVRDSHMTGPIQHVLDYYKSLKLFDKLAHDPKNAIVYKLKEGNFHNLYNWKKSKNIKPQLHWKPAKTVGNSILK